MCELSKTVEEARTQLAAQLNEFRLNAISALNDIELMLLNTRRWPGMFTRLQNCGPIIEAIIVNWQQVEPWIDRYEFYDYHSGPTSMADWQRMVIEGNGETDMMAIHDARMVTYTGSPDNINPEAFITLRSNLLREDIPADLQLMLETLQLGLVAVAKYYEENPPEVGITIS